MEKCPLLKKTNFGVRYHQRHGAMQHLCTCQCKEDRADLFGLGPALVAALTLAAQWPPKQSAAAINPEIDALLVASHDDPVVGAEIKDSIAAQKEAARRAAGGASGDGIIDDAADTGTTASQQPMTLDVVNWDATLISRNETEQNAQLQQAAQEASNALQSTLWKGFHRQRALAHAQDQIKHVWNSLVSVWHGNPELRWLKEEVMNYVMLSVLPYDQQFLTTLQDNSHQDSIRIIGETYNKVMQTEYALQSGSSESGERSKEYAKRFLQILKRQASLLSIRPLTSKETALHIQNEVASRVQSGDKQNSVYFAQVEMALNIKNKWHKEYNTQTVENTRRNLVPPDMEEFMKTKIIEYLQTLKRDIHTQSTLATNRDLYDLYVKLLEKGVAIDNLLTNIDTTYTHVKQGAKLISKPFAEATNRDDGIQFGVRKKMEWLYQTFDGESVNDIITLIKNAGTTENLKWAVTYGGGLLLLYKLFPMCRRGTSNTCADGGSRSARRKPTSRSGTTYEKITNQTVYTFRSKLWIFDSDHYCEISTHSMGRGGGYRKLTKTRAKLDNPPVVAGDINDEGELKLS